MESGPCSTLSEACCSSGLRMASRGRLPRARDTPGTMASMAGLAVRMRPRRSRTSTPSAMALSTASNWVFWAEMVLIWSEMAPAMALMAVARPSNSWPG